MQVVWSWLNRLEAPKESGLFILLILFDSLTTYIGLTKFRFIVEENPTMRFLIETLGIHIALLLTMIASVAVLVMYNQVILKWLDGFHKPLWEVFYIYLWLGILAYLFVVVNNTVVLLRYFF